MSVYILQACWPVSWSKTFQFAVGRVWASAVCTNRGSLTAGNALDLTKPRGSDGHRSQFVHVTYSCVPLSTKTITVGDKAEALLCEINLVWVFFIHICIYVLAFYSYSPLSPVNTKVLSFFHPFSSLSIFMLVERSFFNESWDCSLLNINLHYSCFYGANENWTFENKRLYFTHSSSFNYSLSTVVVHHSIKNIILILFFKESFKS